jgi:hypothetical protein
MVGRTFRIRYSEHGEFRTLLLEGPVLGPSLRPFSFAAHGTSEGTSDVNLDRGIVLRHEQLATTDSVSHVDKTRALPGLVDNRTHSIVRLVVERIP